MTTSLDCWTFLEENFMDVLDFVQDPSPESITITVQGIVGDMETVKVTPDDVAEYYLTQARNISSGIRTLAGHHGDWRPIDQLAQFCLSYFRGVNLEGMRQAAENKGLTPKF